VQTNGNAFVDDDDNSNNDSFHCAITITIQAGEWWEQQRKERKDDL